MVSVPFNVGEGYRRKFSDIGHIVVTVVERD